MDAQPEQGEPVKALTDVPKHPKPGKAYRRFRRRGWRGKVIILLLLVMPVAGIGYAFHLLRAKPDFWLNQEKFLAETTPEERRAMVASVMAKLERADDTGRLIGSGVRSRGGLDDVIASNQFEPFVPVSAKQKKVDKTAVRVDEEVHMRLDNPQIAAMVSENLETWMRERGVMMPDGISKPMAAVRDGQLVLAFELKTSGFTQVFAGFCDVKILPTGRARIKVKKIQAGQLEMPISGLTDYLRRNMPESERGSAQQIGQWISKLQDVTIKPVIKMEHRRRARVHRFRVGSDSLDLWVRVQDHQTYKTESKKLAAMFEDGGSSRPPVAPSAIADVPTD